MGANVSSHSDNTFHVNDSSPNKHLRRTPFVGDDKLRLVEIQNKNQWKSRFNTLKHTNKLLVIDFTAKWCGPCKSLEPKLEEFAAKYNDVEFVKIDVDVLMSLSMQYNVSTLPTIVFMKRGEEVDRVVGVKVDEIQKKIDIYRQSF